MKKKLKDAVTAAMAANGQLIVVATATATNVASSFWAKVQKARK